MACWFTLMNARGEATTFTQITSTPLIYWKSFEWWTFSWRSFHLYIQNVHLIFIFWRVTCDWYMTTTKYIYFFFVQAYTLIINLSLNIRPTTRRLIISYLSLTILYNTTETRPVKCIIFKLPIFDKIWMVSQVKTCKLKPNCPLETDRVRIYF